MSKEYLTVLDLVPVEVPVLRVQQVVAQRVEFNAMHSL